MRIGITERGDAAHHIAQLRRDAALYDGCVWISKAPHAFTNINLPPNVILHATITGFGGTRVEPGVRRPEVELVAYHQLVHRYGGERVVLRVDPIIPTPKGLETAQRIIAQRRGRVRISYLDLYPHVQRRFAAAGITLPWTSFHAPNRPVLDDCEVCGEPGMDCTGCVSARDLAALGLQPPTSQATSSQRPACRCLAAKVELLANRRPCQHGCLYCYWQ
jgi:hypothetical protein